MRLTLLLSIPLTAAVALVAFATPGHSQYMYIDTDADADCDANDVVNSGGPTEVSVWLRTDRNSDGSPASCTVGAEEMSLRSYVVNLRASGGRVSFSKFVNEQPSMTDVLRPLASNAAELTVGYGGATDIPPGLHKLMTVTVTVATGLPWLSITVSSGLQFLDVTSFGSACPGFDFDNTLKLGSDWVDVCGTGGHGGNFSPVITAPAGVSGAENSAITVVGSALDPDASFVTLLQSNDAPFMPSTSSAGPLEFPSLMLTGIPNSSQAGTYTIRWTAYDESFPRGSAAAATVLTVADSEPTLILDQPFDMTVSEGETATQQLTASDPEGDPLTFSKVGPSPFFLSVSAAGLVTLTPDFADVGTYTATVSVTDGVLADPKSFAIAVLNVNRCPTASAGGPYNGIEGVPLAFDASGSSDADGDLLAYRWDFGDLTSVIGVNPIHSYVARGTYPVILTVDDGACQATAVTTATIAGEFTAIAFTAGGDNTTNLGSGKPFTFVQVEPYKSSFKIADVDLSTIRMVGGTGSVPDILAAAGKISVDGDRNGNGVAEIRAGFTKADLRLLFSGLPGGTNLVQLLVEGDLLTGGRFRGSLTHQVKSTGGALAASISPNPMNPSAKATFWTSKPGVVKVQLFDLNGRLVRTYLHERMAEAGYHDVTIDGRTGTGQRVSSGVYFVKFWAEHDGSETKGVTILK